ncbi:hypothetical protein MSAN_00327500 [Mycena sanguinolenta]|uniref:Uncharacterized protein n=1 Tax=Mycena sanguinolenta TaxID=230812 RepID=A0A8H6ZBX2_9AGAR|nr:hypothetical protein MSAN_00327500 [Mycena sanguinolenta]
MAVVERQLELARGNSEGANTAANSPDVLTSRAVVLFLRGRHPHALHHVYSALRGDPGHEPAQRLRKRVKAKDVERLEEATPCSSWIRATLLSNRATTLLKLDRSEDALRDTDASLELVPASFKALPDFKAAIQQVSTDGVAGEAAARALKAGLKKAEAALAKQDEGLLREPLASLAIAMDTDIHKAYRRESFRKATRRDPNSPRDALGPTTKGTMPHYMDLSDLFRYFEGGFKGGTPPRPHLPCAACTPVAPPVVPLLAHTGAFDEITSGEYYMTIGSWHPDEVMQRPGRAFRAAYRRYMVSVRPMLMLIERGAGSADELDDLYERVQRELAEVEGLVPVFHTTSSSSRADSLRGVACRSS